MTEPTSPTAPDSLAALSEEHRIAVIGALLYFRRVERTFADVI
jgi:hypothetical protein